VRRLVCGTHGHCFDGLASATLFTEILEEIEGPLSTDYLACGYGPGHQTPPDLDGDFNALLDYRFVGDQRLTHYFDHHGTAFANDEESLLFQKKQATRPEHFVWDPQAVSCATMIQSHAQSVWGLSLDRHRELLAWAHKIDGARFESASEASSRQHPIMRLVCVVEKFGGKTFLSKAIPILRSEGLLALTEAGFVQDRFRTLAPQYQNYSTRVSARGHMEGAVAFVDLTEAPVNVVTKFCQYESFPSCVYSVLVAQMSNSVKVSVGYNPWCQQTRNADLGKICAAHGGGGHPYVGAVALPRDEVRVALELGRKVMAELNRAQQEGAQENSAREDT